MHVTMECASSVRELPSLRSILLPVPFPSPYHCVCVCVVFVCVCVKHLTHIKVVTDIRSITGSMTCMQLSFKPSHTL